MLSFNLTFSTDKCQTKSFEKMNTLLSAILKFCTTKNLYIEIEPNVVKKVIILQLGKPINKINID